MSERVVVAMSGGVDSSTAAALLKSQGWDVIGIAMKIWDEPDDGTAASTSCCSLDDFNDARRVAEKLGFPFYVVNFLKEFEKEVVDYFTGEYLRGRTPNPCIVCNKVMKFDLLLRLASKLGASHLATGHYARVTRRDDLDRLVLEKGVDQEKDQSYFLFNLTQDQLSRAIFPLGGYRKSQVRAMARSWELPVAEKGESQEICFIPHKDYTRFLMERSPAGAISRGEIQDASGRTLGMHEGIPFYTIGQRRGLGLASSEPLYVTEIVPSGNVVRVGKRGELARRGLITEGTNWIIPPHASPISGVTVKIRYRHPGAEAELFPLEGERVRVVFREGQRAVTPGQAAVFYRGDSLIGGGWIAESF